MARAVDDGYANDYVPGLRGSADAARLADELAFSVARLEELVLDPPGLYADVAAADDPEEAIWLTFLIAFYSPLEGLEDPFVAVRGASRPWSGGAGELPVIDGVPAGPRTALGPRAAEALSQYRAWAARAGSQGAALLGDASWTPQRRFDRAYERVALPGFGRVPRFEFLVTVGALGLVELSPSSLVFTEALAPTTVAAKRLFGIGDAMNLSRRFSDLVAATEVPVAAFDLALQNWVAPPTADRITAGSRAEPDVETRARVGAVLGV